MYVVKKIVKGKLYYYGYKCIRVNGKPKSVFVKYFGRKPPTEEDLNE